MNIALIDPDKLTHEVQALLDEHPSTQLLCHIVFAAKEYLARINDYAGDEVSEAWAADRDAVYDRLNEYENLCGQKDSERIQFEVYDRLFGGELNDLWHLSNAAMVELVKNTAKSQRAQQLADSKEYLQQSIADFWSMVGGQGRRYGRTWTEYFQGKEEELSDKVGEKAEQAMQGSVDYIVETKLEPFLERVKSGTKSAGLGLAIGLGVGIVIYLLIRGGSAAAMATPQGRAARVMLK